MASHLTHGPRHTAASLRRRAAQGPGRAPRAARSTPIATADVPAVVPHPGTQPVGTGHPRSWWRELLFVAVLYFAYAGSRLASFTPAGAEIRNGHRVMDFERMLHLDPEHALNDWLFEAPRWLGVAASYFYMSMHYLLTAVTLIWLFRTSTAAYRRARTWLVAMTFPALIVFWLFPVAPPRTLPGGVAHDIVAEEHSYGWWGSGGGTAPRGFSSLVNENAAMPSLHVGWAIWVGWNLVHSSHNRFVRAFGYVYPFITMTVVISTGNHYLVDVLAGALLAVVSKVFVDTVLLARLVPTLRRRRAASSAAAAAKASAPERRPTARTHPHGHRRPLRKARGGIAVRHPGNAR